MFWELEEQELHFCNRCIIKEDGGREDVCFLSLLTLFFLCLFFLDASTMEVTTSPNKKSDNKLHWIRMSGWMDDSRRVDGSDGNEHCFEMMIRQGSEFSIKS